MSNDYTNPNTNPKTITTLHLTLMDPHGTLIDPHDAHEEICVRDQNEENFRDSLHANC